VRLVLAAVVTALGLTAEAGASVVDVVGYGAEGQLAFRSAELALGERVPYRLGMNSQGPTLTPVALSSPMLDSGGGVVEFGPIFGSLIRAPLPPKPSASPLLGLTAQSVLPPPFAEAIVMPELPQRQFALFFGGVGAPASQAIPQTQSGGVAVVTLRGNAVVVGSPLATPIPGAVWLFGSGLAGLAGAARLRARRVGRSAVQSTPPQV
jgi:hypothetical protein